MSFSVSASPEAVVTCGAPQLKFGPGASGETCCDLSQYERAGIFTRSMELW